MPHETTAWEKIKRFYRWYIKGDYHCNKCPYCWCEMNYEGDGDAGCYIKGDLHDSCRLLPPFRHLLGWGRKKRYLYDESHQYDGIGEWYSEKQGQEIALQDSIHKHILPDEVELVRKNAKGETEVIDKYAWLEIHAYKVHCDYEEIAHPFCPQTLKSLWKAALSETWKKVKNIFAPYFT